MTQAGVAPPAGIPSWMLSGRRPFNNNQFGLNQVNVKPHDVDAWVRAEAICVAISRNLYDCAQIADMFKLADKNSTGSITFDEFYTFLQTDSKKEAAKQKDHAIVAIADPVAAQQARMNTPGYALRSLASHIRLPCRFLYSRLRLSAAIGRDMTAGIMGVMGVHVAPNSQADQFFHPPPYVPGEMTSAHRQAVDASPEMSALFQRNPALVTDFFTHQYTDPARCQRLLAENPELAAASNAMQMQMMQQRMAMQAQMGNPYAAPLPGGGY